MISGAAPEQIPEQDVVPLSPETRQLYRMSRYLLLVWAALVVSSVLLGWVGNSIMAPWYLRWAFGLMMGVIHGSFLMGIYELPWMAFSYAILRWLKVRDVKIAWLVMGLPLGYALVANTQVALTMTLPGQQPARFERITGKAWPQGASLLAWLNSFLAADRKYIWFFESAPEVFDRFSHSGEWAAITAEDLQWDFHKPRFSWHALPTQFPPSWQPTEFWYWAANKEAQAGPFGPLYLFTDSTHTYWCVWNDGI